MMDAASPIHGTILDNMEDGVLSVAPDGRIVTFNAAAARILGVAGDALPGRVFAEVFLVLEGLDEFTQAMLDAIDGEGEAGRKVVTVQIDGNELLLAVNVSWPQTGEGGAEGPIGLIAVFTDITEIRDLRETEFRLGEQVKAQYAELQTAYRTIEERNAELTSAMRRGQVVRAVATVVVLAVFLGVGLYAWHDGPILVPAPQAAPEADAFRTLVVQPERLLSTITVPGRFAPGRTTSVVSPIEGAVEALYFDYGDDVEQGQLLLQLGISKVQQEYRSLRSEQIAALKRVRELDDWENSPDMVAARRTLDEAKRQLENQKHKVEQAAFLLERGVIPAAEHEAAVERHESLHVDYEIARQALEVAQEKGGADAQEMAQLAYHNLQEQLQEREAVMEAASVRAPVAGVIIAPSKAEGGDGARLLEGQAVKLGQLLLTVADVGSMSVSGLVDEVDVIKLRPAQPVTVTSDAVPDLRLAGQIAHVSLQALDIPGSNQPGQFKFEAALTGLGVAQQQRLRLGMSADVVVVTRDDPDALLVPLAALSRANGALSVRVRDRDTGVVQRVAVETGTTTPEAVEITRGLQAGDEVIVSGQTAGAAK